MTNRPIASLLATTALLATSCVAFDASGSDPDAHPDASIGSTEQTLSSSPILGYPTGDKITYPAGGGGWVVSQPLGHWSNIYPFIGNHQAEDLRNSTSDSTTFQPVYRSATARSCTPGPTDRRTSTSC